MNSQKVEIVRFKNRTIISDDRLIKLITEIPPDTFLISSDGEMFPSHYMVLTMFSQYFRKYFNQEIFQHGMKSKCSKNAKVFFCLKTILFLFVLPCYSSNERHFVENSGSCFVAFLRT